MINFLRDFNETLILSHFQRIFKDEIHTLTKPRYDLNLLERNDIWVIQFPQVFNIGLLDITHFLHRHFLPVQFPEKHCSLRPTSQPLEVGYVLKRNFPVVCYRNKALNYILGISSTAKFLSQPN